MVSNIVYGMEVRNTHLIMYYCFFFISFVLELQLKKEYMKNFYLDRFIPFNDRSKHFNSIR